MKLRGVAAIFGSALCVSVMLAAAQEPARPASIEGVVTRAGTDTPLRGAHVTLFRYSDTPTELRFQSTMEGLPPEFSGIPFEITGGDVVDTTRNPAEAITDAQGRFLFGDLTPGRYSMLVQANGYLAQNTGPGQSPPEPASAITLKEGEARSGFAFRLTPAGNISGRLVDSFKRPLSNVAVVLLHPVYDWNGQRSLERVATTRTDDRGEYRIHWITPARYYLRAGDRDADQYRLSDTLDHLQNGGIDELLTNPNEVPANAGVAFYPGVPDFPGAQAIEIHPGEELSGIDWMVPPAPSTHTVRGRVVDPTTGKPPADVEILAIRMNTGLPLTDEDDDPAADKPRYNPSTGRLEIHNLTPGVYQIVAILEQVTVKADKRQPPDYRFAGGLATITIADRDLDDITLTLVPALVASGRFRIEGVAPPPPPPGTDRAGILPWMQVSLKGIHRDVIPDLRSRNGLDGIVNDGVFQLRGLPGEYRVSVFGLPPNGYVKEVKLDGADALNAPLVLADANSTLDVVVSMNGGEIRGVIVDGRGKAAQRTQAFLIPDRSRQRIDLYRNVAAGPDGRFTIRGVAPGDYKLFAWESVETFQWFDPEFVATHETMGTPVHVSESSIENAEVRWIPKGGVQ